MVRYPAHRQAEPLKPVFVFCFTCLLLFCFTFFFLSRIKSFELFTRRNYNQDTDEEESEEESEEEDSEEDEEDEEENDYKAMGHSCEYLQMKTNSLSSTR